MDKTKARKKVTRGFNVVSDGWARAYKPFPFNLSRVHTYAHTPPRFYAYGFICYGRDNKLAVASPRLKPPEILRDGKKGKSRIGKLIDRQVDSWAAENNLRQR